MKKEGIASEGIYTIPEVAKLLQVSNWTIRTMAKSGKIPTAKVGRQYRFCGWQLKEWLDSKRM